MPLSCAKKPSRSINFGGFQNEALQLSGRKLKETVRSQGLMVMESWMNLQGHSLLRRKVKVELWTEGDLGAENKRWHRTAPQRLDHVSCSALSCGGSGAGWMQIDTCTI